VHRHERSRGIAASSAVEICGAVVTFGQPLLRVLTGGAELERKPDVRRRSSRPRWCRLLRPLDWSLHTRRRSRRDEVACSGDDEQAGDVHDGHACGQAAYDGGVEQTAGVIAKRPLQAPHLLGARSTSVDHLHLLR